MACCGDVPTLETLAAVELIRKHLPELKVRVVNVVNLMKLQPPSEHPHGLSDRDFDALFTKDKPIIFAFHGYPWLIHRLTYRRTNHKNLHVRGYKEEGTTTTPFDMVVLNDLDRFHLVEDVIDRLPQLGARAAYFKQAIHEKLIEHKQYIDKHGDDMPAISGWKWGLKEPARHARHLHRRGQRVGGLIGGRRFPDSALAAYSKAASTRTARPGPRYVRRTIGYWSSPRRQISQSCVHGGLMTIGRVMIWRTTCRVADSPNRDSGYSWRSKKGSMSVIAWMQSDAVAAAGRLADRVDALVADLAGFEEGALGDEPVVQAVPDLVRAPHGDAALVVRASPGA